MGALKNLAAINPFCFCTTDQIKKQKVLQTFYCAIPLWTITEKKISLGSCILGKKKVKRFGILFKKTNAIEQGRI